MPIELKHVSYTYDPGLPTAKDALKDVSLTFREKEFVGIIGHTGSGKSTLIQMLNGLIQPTEGEILLNGESYYSFPEGMKKRQLKKAQAARLKSIRQQVGLVFQYPEHQLFEMTVAKDIAFGPANLGLPEEEIAARVDECMAMVGLKPELKEKSPFELSGGQKRRVAIAGVLAMKPAFLVLDEPTAGLDPRGRDGILGRIRRLQEETQIAVILVSHSMEDVADYRLKYSDSEKKSVIIYEAGTKNAASFRDARVRRQAIRRTRACRFYRELGRSAQRNRSLLRRALKTYQPNRPGDVLERLRMPYRAVEREFFVKLGTEAPTGWLTQQEINGALAEAVGPAVMRANGVERLKMLEQLSPPERAELERRIGRSRVEWMMEQRFAGDLTNHARDGTLVRSKSEAIIADLLRDMGAKFRYEEPVAAGGRVLHVDFCGLAPEGLTAAYIEHAGMMDQPNYRNLLWRRMDELIEAGFEPDRNLFLTFDAPDGKTDTNALARKLRYILSVAR